MSKHGHPTYAVGAANFPTLVILTHTIDIFIGVVNFFVSLIKIAR